MPHRTFEIHEVARYLNLVPADVERLVKNQEIPFERHGQRLLFRKVAIDTWASPRVLGMDRRRLADYHRRTASATPQPATQEGFLCGLLQAGIAEPALRAKTKASVIREMCRLAERTGRVTNVADLIEALEAREEVCSTGLPGGLALLHPHHPEDWLFESPFVVLGRTIQRVPYGAPDGQFTDLFFLVACPDPRLHLRTLAKICLLARETDVLEQLRGAATAERMLQALILAEAEILGKTTK